MMDKIIPTSRVCEGAAKWEKPNEPSLSPGVHIKPKILVEGGGTVIHEAATYGIMHTAACFPVCEIMIDHTAAS